MESAKRSRTARSSVQCTNRVAIFPRSETSIFFNRSSRSSNSYKRHFAASRCNWDIRSRTSAEVPGGTKRLSPRQPASPPVPGGKNPATKCRRSTPHQWKPGSPRSSRPARQWQTGPVVKVPVYRWTKGTQPLHLQTQHFVLHFRFDHPPHHIALGRPQMQHALVALPGRWNTWTVLNQMPPRHLPSPRRFAPRRESLQLF